MKATRSILPRLLPLFLSIFTLAACSQQTVKPAKKSNATTHNTTVSTNGGNTNANGGALSTTPRTRDMGGNSHVNTIDAGSLAAINEVMGNKNYTPADLNNPSSILAQRIIYFNYNQASILDKYKPILAAHAELLANYPQVRIRLEGHADERGSREYNVALSERRAQTVRQYLSFKNVESSQMETVAFGEEKPIVASHNDMAWNKNRRVEINYLTY